MGLANISTTQSSAGALVTYTYLGDGTIIGETHSQVSGGLNLVVGLDRFGRVTDQKWTNNSDDVLDEYQYTYDASGNRTSRGNVLDTNLSEVYSYDALSRLVNTARGGAAYQAWTLDQLGNWTGFDDNGASQTRTADTANEITGITTGGNTVQPTYDDAGNMTFDGTLHYAYDAWNRLVQASADDNSDSQHPHQVGALIATYQYDGRGYRVAKTAGTGETAVTTDYYYNDNWQVLEERKGGTPNIQYVWDARYIDTPVCHFRDANGDYGQGHPGRTDRPAAGLTRHGVVPRLSGILRGLRTHMFCPLDFR